MRLDDAREIPVTMLNPSPFIKALRYVADALENGTLVYDSGGLVVAPTGGGMHINGTLELKNGAINA